MRHVDILKLLASGAALCAIAAPVAAQAQAQSAVQNDGPSLESAAEDGRLGDIVVTARKRVENLQQAPLSITAFTSQDVFERGLRDVSDVALFTPGFSMQNIQAGTEQPFIRGMSTTSFDRTLQTSSTFVDGNYFSVLGRTVFFPDIERVEVVRGPQAALFGRATFAGALNFVTKGPTDEPGGEIRLAGGEHRRLNAHASVSGPIVKDLLTYRVSANSELYGGEYNNQPANRPKTGVIRHFGFTGALRLTPTDTLTVDLKGFKTWFRDDGQVPEYIQGAATLNCFPNAAKVFTYYCGKLSPDPKQVSLNLNLVGGGFQNLDQSRGELNVDWKIGDFTLTSVTTAARQHSDTFCDCDYSNQVSSGGAFHSDFVGGIRNRSEEVRLRSPANRRLRALAGLYIFNEKSYSYRANAAAIVIPYVDITTKAAFGSLEFDIVPKLTLTLDGRYQHEEQTRSAIPGNLAVDVDYNAFLPRAIVDFKATDQVLLYASAAKGNQPGQFNTGTNIPQANVRVDSESLWSYEAGAKTQFLDNRLRLNLAGYHIDWNNQVYRAEVVGTDGRIVNVLANLGKSRINGLEAEASAVVAKGLSMNATLAFIDAKYVNFLSPNSLRVYGNAQAKGSRLPNTPRYQASFSTSYRRPLSDSVDGFVRADYSYRGRQYVAEVNQAYIGTLHLLNLSTGIETGPVRFEARVDNVLDNDVPDFATRFSDLNSPALSRFGYLIKLRTGREFRGSLQYRF